MPGLEIETVTTNYARGRAFEYRVRDELLSKGAAYVMRAAGSHTAVDLLALWPKDWNGPWENEQPWLVQCKRDGRLSADDRYNLASLAAKTDSKAFLAKAHPSGRGVILEELED